MRRVLNLLKALFNQTKYLIRTNKYLVIALVIISVFAIDHLGNWECVEAWQVRGGYLDNCHHKGWFWLWEVNKQIKAY